LRDARGGRCDEDVRDRKLPVRRLVQLRAEGEGGQGRREEDVRGGCGQSTPGQRCSVAPVVQVVWQARAEVGRNVSEGAKQRQRPAAAAACGVLLRRRRRRGGGGAAAAGARMGGRQRGGERRR
jgi:hypothetical protein